MPVVRYVALAALVVWLGGAMQALGADLARHITMLALVCGGVMVVALFVMKFVGPPPHAFVLRLALAVLMLAAAAPAWFRGPSTPLLTVTAVLGFVLLSWYARE